MDIKLRQKSLFEQLGAEVAHLSQTIDYSELEQLLNLLVNNSHNIFVTGCGTSAMAAKKIVHTLQVINHKAFYLNPSDAVHGALGAVSADDIVIIISKGGNTKELISFLPNLVKKDTHIVAVTENKNSQIAKTAQMAITIKTNSELDKFGMLATTSTLAVIAVFDVIAVTLMQMEDFSENQFLLNHPSGAVGQQLREELK
ncbi:MAG: SIS domain-containing protein [Lactobacillus sp.]|nr:SIS domain-containing protein [Lactobacillus sp.]